MDTIAEKCLRTTRHIADKILQLRRNCKLTQEEFAEKVGLDRRTIARAEDGKQTVAKYLESVDKALSIAKVVRFEVGEGIEKKEENFAEEVAKQLK